MFNYVSIHPKGFQDAICVFFTFSMLLFLNLFCLQH